MGLWIGQPSMAAAQEAVQAEPRPVRLGFGVGLGGAVPRGTSRFALPEGREFSAAFAIKNYFLVDLGERLQLFAQGAGILPGVASGESYLRGIEIDHSVVGGGRVIAYGTVGARYFPVRWANVRPYIGGAVGYVGVRSTAEGRRCSSGGVIIPRRNCEEFQVVDVRYDGVAVGGSLGARLDLNPGGRVLFSIYGDVEATHNFWMRSRAEIQQNPGETRDIAPPRQELDLAHVILTTGLGVMF